MLRSELASHSKYDGTHFQSSFNVIPLQLKDVCNARPPPPTTTTPRYASYQDTVVLAPQFYVCQTDSDDYCDDAGTTGLTTPFHCSSTENELYWKWNSG